MNQLLSILNHGELCPLCTVVLLVNVVGGLCRSEQEPVGWRHGLAGLATLGFTVQAWLVLKPVTADEFLVLIVRSLLTGGFVLGVTAILIPVVAISQRHASGCWQHWSRERKEQKAQRRLAREQQLQARRQRAEEERWRPLQEQKRQEEMALAETAQLTQQRREIARAELLLCFLLHASALKERLPRETFDDYCTRFLSDSLPAEIVEARGRQLQEAILQLVGHIKPTHQFQSLAELNEWHRQKIADVKTLPEGHTRDFLLSQLCRQFDQMALDFFGE